MRLKVPECSPTLFTGEDMDRGSIPEVGWSLITLGSGKGEPRNQRRVGQQGKILQRWIPSAGFTVQRLIQDLPVEAVVDTGVEVSMLGMEQYYSLGFKPLVKREVTLLQGGTGAQLSGFIAGPFSIQVGENVHEVDLYVAPLKDPMLLRLDFREVRVHTVKLDLEHGILSMTEEKIQMIFGRVEPPDEARMLLVQKVYAPVISVALYPSHFDKELADCMVEPCIERLSKVLPMPHTCYIC